MSLPLGSQISVGRQQLYLLLRQRIEQGQYPHGAWLPAERAIAQEFGVDRSAVRNALHQLEEQGMIVREPGRRPWVRHGETARPPQVRAALGTLVAIVPQHPIYPASLAILHGINATLRSREAPYRLQIFDTHEIGASAMLEKQALEDVLHENADGLILWHMGGAETLPQLLRLQERGMPFVLVDRYPPELDCDFVGVDNSAGIEEAVGYLHQLGHRRIAYLTTDEKTTAVLQRLAAYREVMQRGGIAPPDGWIHQLSEDSPSDMQAAFAQFFGLAEPPTAVLAMNDSLAHYFIVEVEARGKSVPGDVSVVGFDDLERHSPRPALLTTMHQPFDKIGRRAASLLLHRLSAPESAAAARQHILLPAPLVVRSTCRPLGQETSTAQDGI